MQIELLYFEGCPSWHEALENVKIALDREGIAADIWLVRVDGDAEAARLKFLGSPTFRVNGEDLWPEVRREYSLCCRVYPTPAGLRGAPSVEMLQEKLDEIFHA